MRRYLTTLLILMTALAPSAALAQQTTPGTSSSSPSTARSECQICEKNLIACQTVAGAFRATSAQAQQDKRVCEAERIAAIEACAESKAELTRKLEDTEEEKERRWRPGKVILAVGLALLAGFGAGKLHGGRD